MRKSAANRCGSRCCQLEICCKNKTVPGSPQRCARLKICADNGPLASTSTVRVLKKNQAPIYDTFGPFPDETLLSSIDRVLYLLGASRIRKLFNTLPIDANSMCSACSCAEDPTSRASYRSAETVRSPAGTRCKCCASAKDASNLASLTAGLPGTISVCSGSLSARSSRCSCRNSRTKQRESSPCDDGFTPRKNINPLKRSFSLCSLACRKLKQKLTFQTAAQKKDNWFWTRMQSSGDGYKIYEIYKNSNINSHPTKNGHNVNPQMVFVVLPSGTIVPFETLTCH